MHNYILLQVVLSFYEKRVRQQWGLAFGKQEERLFWEQWCARHSGFRTHVSGCFGKQEELLFWEQWCARQLGFRVEGSGRGVCACSWDCLAALEVSFVSCACLFSMFWDQWCVRTPRLHCSSTSQPVPLAAS